MKITVRFEDGPVESFDTNALTSTSPLGRGNAFTDLRVTVGDGLWAEVSWYRVMPDPGDGDRMPLAQRSPGCRIHVLSDDEMRLVRSIELDGRVQWLRIGPDLCDVSRLDEATDLFCGLSKSSTSIAARAANIHDTLVGLVGNGDATEDSESEVCAMLGMTEASYEFLSAMAANVYLEQNSF